MAKTVKIDYEDETVSIRLAPDPGSKEQPHVTVSVNGKVYRIQRGKIVNVPRFVARIVAHSEAAEQKAIDFINSKGKE